MFSFGTYGSAWEEAVDVRRYQWVWTRDGWQLAPVAGEAPHPIGADQPVQRPLSLRPR